MKDKLTPMDKVMKDLLSALIEKGIDIEDYLVKVLYNIDVNKVSRCRMSKKFAELLDIDEDGFLTKRKIYTDEQRKYNRQQKKQEYYDKNRDRLSKYKNEYLKRKRREDNMYRVKHVMRNLVLNSFKNKGYKKNSKTEDVLGCTYDFFIEYIESKFEDGMTWDNRGVYGWHIDHIYPISLAKDEKHLVELNHYTNLQPLWAKDNLQKGNKLNYENTNI
jgi:hypothetical protein